MLVKKRCCLIAGIIIISSLYVGCTNISLNDDNEPPVMQEFQEEDLQYEEDDAEKAFSQGESLDDSEEEVVENYNNESEDYIAEADLKKLKQIVFEELDGMAEIERTLYKKVYKLDFVTEADKIYAEEQLKLMRMHQKNIIDFEEKMSTKYDAYTPMNTVSEIIKRVADLHRCECEDLVEIIKGNQELVKVERTDESSDIVNEYFIYGRRWNATALVSDTECELDNYLLDNFNIEWKRSIFTFQDLYINNK